MFSRSAVLTCPHGFSSRSSLTSSHSLDSLRYLPVSRLDILSRSRALHSLMISSLTCPHGLAFDLPSWTRVWHSLTDFRLAFHRGFRNLSPLDCPCSLPSVLHVLLVFHSSSVFSRFSSAWKSVAVSLLWARPRGLNVFHTAHVATDEVVREGRLVLKSFCRPIIPCPMVRL